MADPKNIKDQVRKLLESDQRYQAIRLIQNTYGVSEADAEKLLSTLDSDDEEPKQETQQPQSTQSSGCSGCFSGLLKVGSVLIGLLGLLFLAVTAFFYYFYEDFKNDAIPVKGIVADTVYAAPVTSTDTIRQVFLVFEYQVADSAYRYQTITTYPAHEYLVQDSVDLFINGSDPTYASLASDDVMEDFYLIFGIAAGVCLFLAIVLWLLSRASRSTKT